ncbi:MAG: carbamoyltransferase [Cyanobacteriota bacterium]
MGKVILGISAFYHDSAAAIVEDGKILAAVQEERLSRKKHDPAFPANAVRFCLDYSGYSLNQVDAVVFYEKPFLKFERLLETYYVFAPRGLQSFLSAIPVWIKEKLFLKKLIREELSKIEDIDISKINLLFSEHHLSHAASAFYPSPFEEAAILTVDGVGEWATGSICHGKGKNIEIIKELRFPHSIGLLYSAFTYYLGFKVNSGEYKLMGLSPYGDPDSNNLKIYKDLIYRELIDVKEDGSIFLNQDYFDYATGLKMIVEDKWEKLFNLKTRKPESELEQSYCDMALAIQQITEDVVLKMANHARELTGSKHICLAGGVALNCCANGKLLRSKLFDDLWIQPASGDAGGALGAALAVNHIYFGNDRKASEKDSMNGSYLGPEYSDLDIKQAARKYKGIFTHYSNFNELCKHVSGFIDNGKVIGWFQGRNEWGPRALGNRSIIGDPRNKEMQKRLNLKIKFRESFRPFAPSVLIESTPDYFDMNTCSPYMLLITDVVENRRSPLPENYHQLSVRDKLYFIRSDIPSITHLDYSARLQTVHKDTNPRYWQLINTFKELTGYGVIVNTSFNVRGEPIVCSPEDAYKCFMRTDMDYLVLGDYLFDKKDQPKWHEDINWKEEYGLD